jgi:exodeoxyribonuclease V alpha subunit
MSPTAADAGPLPGERPGTDALEIEGRILRIRFHSPETDYHVLQVECAGGELTLCGTGHRLQEGAEVRARGQWTVHPTYGEQFQADWIHVRLPASAEGIRRYLASGMVEGIGRTIAERLTAHFGDEVFRVALHAPERLREVGGVGPKRAASIGRSLGDHLAIHEIIAWLISHRADPAVAARIFRHLGHRAVAVLERNPYRLTGIRGIGFLTADRIARTLGIDPAGPHRLRAGLAHVLEEARKQGHCGLPERDLLNEAWRLLELRRHGAEPGQLRDALAIAGGEGEVVALSLDERPMVFHRRLFDDEVRIAREVETRLALGRPAHAPPLGEMEGWVPRLEAQLDIRFSGSQAAALMTLLQARLGVLTGGPGTGKTTIVRALIAFYEARGLRVVQAAPTGTAAKRMRQATGHDARTMHRLVGLGGEDGPQHDADHPIDADVVVLDEQSMTDVWLMATVLAAIPPEATVLLVGDPDQLPSVGPGRVLLDLIASGRVPVARLAEVHRQAARSRIVTAAHAVNGGELPDLGWREESDLFFFPAAGAEEAARRTVEAVCRWIPERFGLDPLAEVQVLAPMKRGSCGVHALNLALQERLNPLPPGHASLVRFGQRFAAGDRVMQMSNNYALDVMNGEVGQIARLERVDGETLLEVAFDGRTVDYPVKSADDLALAYAATTHKSQGSEYPAVVVPLVMQHYAMLERALLYTAITRAARLLVLVGEERAIRRAAGTVRGVLRHSLLLHLLRSRSVRPLGAGPG